MTLLALRGVVRTREGELSGSVVVEHGPRPLRGAMAEFAILRETGCGMVRILCLLILRQVAARTVLRSAFEYVIHVALLALHAGMRAREGELRSRVVIECRSFPLLRVVAQRAVLRESCYRMIGPHR